MVYRNSMRYWLQAHQRLVMPNRIRPFNPAWKYNANRDTPAIRRLILRLREIADGLEARL